CSFKLKPSRPNGHLPKEPERFATSPCLHQVLTGKDEGRRTQRGPASWRGNQTLAGSLFLQAPSLGARAVGGRHIAAAALAEMFAQPLGCQMLVSISNRVQNLRVLAECVGRTPN